MTRAMKMSAFVAMGLLMTATTVAAQNAPATSGGQVTIGALGTGSVGSSKFTEYREVPKGVNIPFINLYSTGNKIDFNLTGYNVQQADQRYLGSVAAHGMGLKFDWNEIPHDMGNGGRTIFNQSAPGVWTMSNNLQKSLEAALNAKMPTSARTYDWYSALLWPTFESANRVDLSGARKTGNVALNLGTRLPADVTLTYRNESKTGYRGLGSVNIRGIVSPSTEFANPMDEISHDFGVRAARKFASGNVYASVNRSVYDNRAETVMVDYPWQAVDAPTTAAVGSTIPAMGGTSRERFVMAPDNEALTSSAGFLFKLKRMTRISGGFTLGSRTQDAPFYPYTANTAVLNAAGVNAGTLAALARQSYGGKVNTTAYNLAFSTRPIEGLDLRAAYRVYDLTDKSNKWIVAGDMSAGNAGWTVVTPTAADPFGHATSNIYDTKTSRLTASATYDFKDLTLEGQFRSGQLERTSREAEKGTESGMGFTAMYHMSEWLGFRGTYDVAKRTADGHTIYGFQSDEAAFTNTRTGIDVELTPMAGLDLSVAYFRRNVDYTGRPNRVAVVSGVATATVFPNTPSGLLGTTYDSYTGEINFAPNERVELGAYYTYEKDANTNQWSTTTTTTVGGVATYSLNNVEKVLASNKTGTFGVNATFQLVPDKRSFSINATRQKLDGLADITIREAGSLYTPGRVGLVPAGTGGAADIDEWDDTELTTISAQFDFALVKNWTMSAGYMYEKYDFKDAFNATSRLMPSAVNIFMKPNDGAYNASVLFAQMSYKF